MNNFNPLRGDGRDIPTDFDSRDPLVNDTFGNAYHVVRSVYGQMGMLDGLYEFLLQYGLTTNVAVKSPVEAVVTEPNSLEGNQVINWTSFSGSYQVLATTGMRVLVLNQTNPKDNGIYNVNPRKWTRAVDFIGSMAAVDGTLVFSRQGDAWQVDSPTFKVEVGVTPIVFRAIDLFAREAQEIAIQKAAEAAASAAAALLSEQASKESETNAAASAQDAEGSKVQATQSANAAEASRSQAANSAAEAKASELSAADFAAMAESVTNNDRTFDTVADGLAGVADGQYFRVIAPSITGEVAFTYYKKVGTNAVKKTEVSSANGNAVVTQRVNAIETRTSGINRGTHNPFEIIDSHGSQALYIDESGKTGINGGLNLGDETTLATPKVGGDYVYAVTDAQQRVAFGIGKDGFIEILGVRIKSTFGPNLIELIDKDKRLAGGIRSNGTFFSSSSETGTPGGEYMDFAERMHMFIYGQSLSNGAIGTPVLGTAAYDGIMFNTGVRSYGKTQTSLVPLAENQEGNLGETIASGLSHDFTQKSGGMYGRKLMMNAGGINGIQLVGLIKGTSPYTSAVSKIAWVANDSVNAGISYSFDFMLWLQGEADMAVGTPAATYTTMLQKLRSDLSGDTVNYRTGGRDLVMLTYQTSSHGYYVGTPENPPENIAQVQLDTALTHPLIDMWGPTYMGLPGSNVPGEGSVHHNNHGYRLQGLYASKAVRHRVRTRSADKPNGEKYLPMHATKATRINATTYLVDVFTYHPPLVIDASLIKELDDGMHGVEAGDNTGRIQVTSVTISGGNKIKVTTAFPLGDGAYIAFAWTPENRGEIKNVNGNPRYADWFFGRLTGVRTTIRDSDPETTDMLNENGVAYPLHNYMPIQKIFVQ